jgi:ubiquitin carboxyl-terminal hydrolase 1
MKDIGKSVFDGLTANRRSCCLCGYTEAVMHFPLDNLQLALPRLAVCNQTWLFFEMLIILQAVCQLEDCLEDYTRLEELKDCICRKCSVVATHKRLQQDIKKLEHEIQSQTKPSNSKKERLRKVRKMEAKVRTAIQEERIEEDLKDVRMEKVFSPLSTKQAMIARVSNLSSDISPFPLLT